MQRAITLVKIHSLLLVVITAVVLIGILMMFVSRANTPAISVQPEAGNVTSPATIVSDATASGGKAVKFSANQTCTVNCGGNSTTPNFKVAFIGDSGRQTNSKLVFELMRKENAQLLVHLGDFDYGSNPSAWESFITPIIGSTHPMMAVIGNHDNDSSSAIAGYQSNLEKRKGNVIVCNGSRALRAVCKMNGLVVIEEGIGEVYPSNNVTDVNFIRDSLAANSSALWKVCAWHEQMATLQVGGKGDSTGYNPYEECRKAGAMVFTGHEHSYQRTKTLTSFSTQTVDSSCNSVTVVCLGPGRSFTAVSGAGGVGLRDQNRCLPATPPYGCKGEWASIYTTNQGAKHGALFITFNVNGNPKLAHGVFKNIAGEVIDQFEIRRD